ncbi:unnamed protein product [Darwinula stevensoni]|uniref:TOG domain-containing protein n=1 Tax=Darwinula stevensoni TaxID=69355 RepID=A0A7R8XDW7_9CRUS|nr:unnamed protein product [Darwinula stevensoni]CAG0893472.1 unnamed protein product [Darwinula stevensoni]
MAVANCEELVMKLSSILLEANKRRRRIMVNEVFQQSFKWLSEADLSVHMPDSLPQIISLLLKLMGDDVERCREASSACLAELSSTMCLPLLPQLLETLKIRLRTCETSDWESSEEVRLNMVHCLNNIVKKEQENIFPYFSDVVDILKDTLQDDFPEVRCISCECVSSLARSISENFHMQSQSLIAPLLKNISHSHSKIRLAAVQALGDAMEYGNQSCMPDVVPHCAQRLFDGNPRVRQAMSQVSGRWLKTLKDRYAYFHHLLPLLLTNLEDEVPTVQEEASHLWSEVGLQYLSENEDEFKEQLAFPTSPERGDRMTMHLLPILNAIIRGSGDSDLSVRKHVLRSADLVGKYSDSSIWVKLILSFMDSHSNKAAVLRVLAHLLRGLQKNICLDDKLLETVQSPMLCHSFKAEIQEELLACTWELYEKLERSTRMAEELCHVLLGILALTSNEDLRGSAEKLLVTVAQSDDSSMEQLILNHVKLQAPSWKSQCVTWDALTPDFLIFNFVAERGLPWDEHTCSSMLEIYAELLIRKDSGELRGKALISLSQFLSCATQIDNGIKWDANSISEFIKDVLMEMLKWEPGRTAGALRAAGMSCICQLLKKHIGLPKEIIERLLFHILKLLEDDAPITRRLAASACTSLFQHEQYAAYILKDAANHCAEELVKRVDDVEWKVTATALEALRCLTHLLPRGEHLDCYSHLIETLLIHLDEDDPLWKQEVFCTLKALAKCAPDVLKEEITKIQWKPQDPCLLEELEMCMQPA